MPDHNRILKTLTVGQEIKNYKVLCELLGETVTVGRTRQYQLKEWKRFFDWEKQGQKFIITDIYPEPLPKEMKEGTVYAKLIETLLVAHLSKQENYTYTATESQIFETLCMVNSNYKKIRDPNLYTALTSTKSSSPVLPINYIDFNQRSHKRLKEILHSALNSMVSRRLLEYTKETVIVIIHPDLDGTPIYENIVANSDEIKEILRIERQVMNEMGVDNIFQLYAQNKMQTYNQKVDSKLKEEFNWDHVYRRLKLVYNQSSLEGALEQTKKNLFKAADLHDIRINKEKLNLAIVNMFNTEAQKRTDKYVANPDTTNARLSYLEDPRYVVDQRFLTDYFIKY